MNAPFKPESASDRLAARMAELDARFAPEWECQRRAMRIVDRVLPRVPAVSPLTDAQNFMAGAVREGDRRELYRTAFARLMAKKVPVEQAEDEDYCAPVRSAWGMAR